jgi:CheY-like chemotaxis protein
MEAQHLARDLAALAPEEPEAVRLVLLARLEALLAAGGNPVTVLDRVAPDQLRNVLTGPDGFDVEAAADVLERAASRGLTTAATAAARVIAGAGADDAPLSPQVRQQLLRAMNVPDGGLQFEAARALALAAGDPPYRGASRVVEILTHAATATGADVAVVAHPDAAVRESLATGLSRFGYRAEKVATGREAILAARAGVDTVLVVLASRIGVPSAFETVQLIQGQPVGDVPPVLVVVDPLDDAARGCHLTTLLLTFADSDCVGITDRMDSLFQPRIDPVTGAAAGPPRFPDVLATVAGPRAVDPTTRRTLAAQRRARASAALALLAELGRRGGDNSAAETTARLALAAAEEPSPRDLFTPALALLSTLGSPQAQQAVLREAERTDLPVKTRRVALAGFAGSVRRYGILLESGPLQEAYAMYNRARSSTDRDVAAAILDVLETPLRHACPAPADAARPRQPR